MLVLWKINHTQMQTQEKLIRCYSTSVIYINLDPLMHFQMTIISNIVMAADLLNWGLSPFPL